MYTEQIKTQAKKLDILLDMQAKHEYKMETERRTRHFNQYAMLAIGALIGMNFLPAMLALIAHFLLLYSVHQLAKYTPFALKAFMLPFMTIAWLWFIGSVCWQFTFGLIF